MSSAEKERKLLVASWKGDVVEVESLIKAGVNVGCKDHYDWTPLHIAAQNGHADVTTTLIEAGADHRAKTDAGETLLHFAAGFGHANVTTTLIEAGADHSAKNKYGSTPLHYAARNGHANVTSTLIEAGADHRAKDNDGNTPLHFAAFWGRDACATLLLEAGADRNAKNNDGETPAAKARSWNKSYTALLIDSFDVAAAQRKRDAEAQAKRDAEAQAKRDADEQARRDAEAQARRDAEQRARREAQERAAHDAAQLTPFLRRLATPDVPALATDAQFAQLFARAFATDSTGADVVLRHLSTPPRATTTTPPTATTSAALPAALRTASDSDGVDSLFELLDDIDARTPFEHAAYAVAWALLDAHDDSAQEALDAATTAATTSFSSHTPTLALLSFARALLHDARCTVNDDARVRRTTCRHALSFVLLDHRIISAQPDTPRAWPDAWIDTASAIVAKHADAVRRLALPSDDDNDDSNNNNNNTNNSNFPANPSLSPADDWARRDASARAKCPSVDKLMKLVGLDAVKRKFLALFDSVQLCRLQGASVNELSYHVRFDGNPGTGKTTVAKLYASFLSELGVFSASECQESTGAKLGDGGLDKLNEHLSALANAGGGVLFIDEAYQLDPTRSSQGRKVLDALLTEMEDKRDRLAVVLAGYEKHMDKLFEHNPGLPGRVKTRIVFADYTDAELESIYRSLLTNRNKPFAATDDKWIRIAATRLGRQRGSSGFGNARAVRNSFEQARERLAARLKIAAGITEQQALTLERDDVLGPRITRALLERSSALAELRAMVGLDEVKRAVDALLDLVLTNAELEEQERPLREVSLNRVFLGNPGTGKTTVARLYARVLGDLGLLSKGELVMCTPADLVGSVLGASEQRTQAMLDKANGSVLVVDEAYGLHSATSTGGNSDPYKTSVVDTIVATVQNVPGEDRAVLLLGYDDEMREMLRGANPGLARRFNVDDAFVFADYDDAALKEIMKKKASRSALRFDKPTLPNKIVKDVLAKQRMQPRFGNAGAVENLLTRAKQRMGARLGVAGASSDAARLTYDDFLSADDVAAQSGSASDLFADLVGCEHVLSTLRELQATIKLAQSQGRDPLAHVELNFVFTGNAGTGKTTVARRMGKMFRRLGLLPFDDVVERSADDLHTGFAGQAAHKTRQTFETALGRVLFIDEAYKLNPRRGGGGGAYMQEIVDEMVKLLTDERFMGKMVVILAGYDEDMDELMTVNQGLKSRFSQRWRFANFDPDTSANLLRRKLEACDLSLSVDADAALVDLIRPLVNFSDFGNGRELGTFAKKLYARFAVDWATESGASSSAVSQVSLAQLQAVFKAMMAEHTSVHVNTKDFLRTAASTSSVASPSSPPPQLQQQQHAAAPPPAPLVAATTSTTTSEQSADEQSSTSEREASSSSSSSSSPYASFDREFLSALNDLYNESVPPLANNASDAERARFDAAVRAFESDADEQRTLRRRLAARLKREQEEIERQLAALARARAEEQRKAEEEARRRRARVPVWQCQVCGRTAVGYIPCYVAPQIIRYVEREEGGC